MITQAQATYDLSLFVSGASDLSARAIADAQHMCEVNLAGRYHLSVVDLHEDPAAGRDSQVLVAPTLVRNRPLPVRRLVGDLSDAARVLSVLELSVKDAPESVG